MVDASVFSGLGRRPADRRGMAILVGSAVLHVGVMAVLGLSLYRAAEAPPLNSAPIFVEMEPRPLLKGETARAPSPSSVRALETRPLTGARPDVPTTRDPDDKDRPSPPAPRMPAGGAQGTPGAPVDNPWTYRPESLGAAVGRSMRTGAGGCRIMDGRLSASEQALCDDRFIAGAVEGARRHPPGGRTLTPSEQRREAQFAAEGAAALRRYEAQRAPLRPGPGILMTSGECPGGNFGTGCAGAHLDPSMREGAQTLNRMESGRQGYRPLPGHE